MDIYSYENQWPIHSCFLEKQSGFIITTDHFTHTLHDSINYFFPDSVMATSVVVGRVLLSRDQLLRVKEFFVLSNPHFI